MLKKLNNDIYKKAYTLMCTARAMTDIFEKNKAVTSKYVHATSAGHEAIQLAVACSLLKMIGQHLTTEMMLCYLGLE